MTRRTLGKRRVARRMSDWECECKRFVDDAFMNIASRHRPRGPASPVSPSSGRRGRPFLVQAHLPRPVHVLVDAPRAAVQRRRRQRVDQFRVQRQVSAQHQDGAGVVRGAAVVGRREHRDEQTAREPLEPVHHALVRANDHLQVVVLAELAHAVGPERHQTRTARVGPQTFHLVALRRVRPEHVHQHHPPALHGQRPLELLQLRDVRHAPPDATVHARHSVLDDRGERQPLEHVVEPVPRLHARRFAEAIDALDPKPEQRVDVRLFVVPPQQMHAVRVLHLER
mmetsp:Transcript_10899/g.45776  ORF Transcript_10899/g.45776 Transcript_10899/m.45776 type:complete len:283 (-) Transcript_10899:2276-3124(-)